MGCLIRIGKVVIKNLRQHLIDHGFHPFGRRPGYGHLLLGFHIPREHLTFF